MHTHPAAASGYHQRLIKGPMLSSRLVWEKCAKWGVLPERVYVRPTFLAPEQAPICERKDLLARQELRHPQDVSRRVVPQALCA